MNQNVSLLTTAAGAELTAAISNYGAGVFAHVNGDWQQHSQSRLYTVPYVVETSFINAATILITVYSQATDTGADILLTNPLGTFTASSIDFFSSTNGQWYPFNTYHKRFGASMIGSWNVAVSGRYTFRLSAEWGAYLWIDGQLVINNGLLGGQYGISAKPGSLFLGMGSHSFLVKYWSNGPPPSGCDLGVPPGIALISTVAVSTKTVAQNSLMLLLDYADLNGNPATQAVAVPAVLTGSAPVSTPAPVIVIQPASVSVALNGAVAFSVVAISELALFYQWYVNGAAISGASLSVLEINNVTSANVGNYYVSVTSANGSVTSNTVTLSLYQA